MLNIRRLIHERAKYGIVPSDAYFSAIIGETKKAGTDRKNWKKKDNSKEIAFITHSLPKTSTIKGWSVKGVFSIGKVFANVPIEQFIVLLTKSKLQDVQFAIWRGDAFDSMYSLPMELHKNNNEIILPDAYLTDWEEYITSLESWINGGTAPEDREQYEFHVVDTLYKDSLHPETYSNEATVIRRSLASKDVVPLSEIAYIYRPKKDKTSEERVKVLNTGNPGYPLDVEKLKSDTPTDVILKQGDIIFDTFSNTFGDDKEPTFYLFQYDGNEKIYASVFFCVIRCENVLPEYLYLYLNSNTAARIWNTENVGRSILGLSPEDLNDFPIPIPSKPDDQYKKEFEILTNAKVRDYDSYQRLQYYYDNLLTEPEKCDIEDIINLEIVKTVKIYRENQLLSLLKDDMTELNKCFACGAYKATLILAGSILEAVIIDWLSEISGTNYFEEDFIIEDPRTYERHKATLAECINEIERIKAPAWMEGAEKANEIRKKRNLVHAKLCLAETVEINEEICREVVSYLEYVIETRNTVR